jgi:hypothetical protein
MLHHPNSLEVIPMSLDDDILTPQLQPEDTRQATHADRPFTLVVDTQTTGQLAGSQTGYDAQKCTFGPL